MLCEPRLDQFINLVIHKFEVLTFLYYFEDNELEKAPKINHKYLMENSWLSY